MRRVQSSRIAAAIALSFGCGKAREESPPATAPPAPAQIAPRPADAAAHVDAAESHVTITVDKPRPPGSGLAKRCALGGDPITGGCIASGGIVVDAGGRMYLVAGPQVRRYKRAGGDDCRFDPDGDPIALPPETKRMQRFDKGPIYMRSGGPDWHLAPGARGAVLAHDYLGGLFRVDRGKPERVCTDVFGFSSVAALGGKLLVARRGLEQLTPGKPCTAKSAGIDDKARGDVYAIRDRLYVAARGSGDLARYDGTVRVPLAEGTRICSVVAAVPCGDGLCAVDNNCPQVLQLDVDDKVVRTIKADRLFDTRPYSLAGAAAHNGDVLLLASHRTDDLCETAVYRLPASSFTAP